MRSAGERASSARHSAAFRSSAMHEYGIRGVPDASSRGRHPSRPRCGMRDEKGGVAVLSPDGATSVYSEAAPVDDGLERSVRCSTDVYTARERPMNACRVLVAAALMLAGCSTAEGSR